MITRETIRRSLLWAAYGDALGFITEFCNESSLIKRTRGRSKVTELIPWVRRIGGQFGINVELPQGCYSDDTQLRLATSRSIRGDGTFDVETFSKVELPVWLSYALGAGTGTKTAAMSLVKRQVQWNTNFFKTSFSQYIQTGGNGASMRIQPHVWCAPKNKSNAQILRDIVRNTVTTHGHCRALIGSAFHALILRKTMLDHSIPGPAYWHSVLSDIKAVPKIMNSDEQLRMYWIKNWERESNKSLEEGVFQSLEELQRDIHLIEEYIKSSSTDLVSDDSYRYIANKLGCLENKTRGSAPKTALLAAYISYVFRDNIHNGLVTVVNSLGTDTDTIATMAGAIMGILARKDPPEEVMDQAYLNQEAERLYNISQGAKVSSYSYPDLLYWQPPFSQIKALGNVDNKLVLKGFGEIVPIGSEYKINERNPVVWQWFKLQFGQTVLLKRSDKVDTISEKLLPVNQQEKELTVSKEKNTIQSRQTERRLRRKEVSQAMKQAGLWDDYKYRDNLQTEELTIEKAADLVVKSRFKTNVIGSLLLKLAAQENGEEKSMLFAKLIAKARNARIKR